MDSVLWILYHMGHACGVRVHWTHLRCEGSQGSEGSEGSKGGGIALTGDEYKVSVTGLAFSVIWYDRHSADWLAALASPYPASPDFSTGKHVTRFSGRFASLRIVFPCHPCSGGRINRSVLSCRDMAPWLSIHSPTTKWGKGGGASHQRGMHFQRPQGGCKGFIIRGRLLSIKRRPPRQRVRSANQ